VGYSDSQVLETAAAIEPVLEQKVNWYPATWRSALDRHALGAMLASVLERMPDAAAVGQGHVTRRNVLGCFEVGPVEGYLAAMVWGCGTSAINIGRMLRVFNANEEPLKRITEMVAALEGADAGRAWDVIASQHRLKMLGPAFGTKVAYFTALAHPPAEGAVYPLIADARVAAMLGSPVTRQRDAYVAYCSRAYALSCQLPSELRRADQIEYALFKLGD